MHPLLKGLLPFNNFSVLEQGAFRSRFCKAIHCNFTELAYSEITSFLEDVDFWIILEVTARLSWMMHYYSITQLYDLRVGENMKAVLFSNIQWGEHYPRQRRKGQKPLKKAADEWCIMVSPVTKEHGTLESVVTRNLSLCNSHLHIWIIYWASINMLMFNTLEWDPSPMLLQWFHQIYTRNGAINASTKIHGSHKLLFRFSENTGCCVQTKFTKQLLLFSESQQPKPFFIFLQKPVAVTLEILLFSTW